jgi:hypothetical protein
MQLRCLRTALKYQPGNQRYALRIAEILVRQNKFADASAIAQKIASTAGDAEVKNRAESLLRSADRIKEFNDRQAADRKRYEAMSTGPGGTNDTVYIEDPDAIVRSVNEALRKTATDEKRVIGSVQKIDCRTQPIVYTIKTPTEAFTLTTKDFDSLVLNAFTSSSHKMEVGCDENISAINAVITYRPKAGVRGTARGELIAIEFVQNDFRFLDPLAPPPISKRRVGESITTAGTLQPPPPLRSAEAEEQRRAMMMQALRESLRKPADGQKRETGYLDKIECSNKGMFMIFRTPAKTYRLLTSSPETLAITIFAPELGAMQFGCAIKPIEFPAIFIYNEKPDAKGKTDGEIVSVEFVPKSFTLEP